MRAAAPQPGNVDRDHGCHGTLTLTALPAGPPEGAGLRFRSHTQPGSFPPSPTSGAVSRKRSRSASPCRRSSGARRAAPPTGARRAWGCSRTSEVEQPRSPPVVVQAKTGAWQQVAGGEPGEPSIPDSAPPEARRYRALGSSRAPTVALRGQLDLKGARRYRRPGTGRILRILRREYKYGYYMS